MAVWGVAVTELPKKSQTVHLSEFQSQPLNTVSDFSTGLQFLYLPYKKSQQRASIPFSLLQKYLRHLIKLSSNSSPNSFRFLPTHSNLLPLTLRSKATRIMYGAPLDFVLFDVCCRSSCWMPLTTLYPWSLTSLNYLSAWKLGSALKESSLSIEKNKNKDFTKGICPISFLVVTWVSHYITFLVGIVAMCSSYLSVNSWSLSCTISLSKMSWLWWVIKNKDFFLSLDVKLKIIALPSSSKYRQ